MAKTTRQDFLNIINRSINNFTICPLCKLKLIEKQTTNHEIYGHWQGNIEKYCAARKQHFTIIYICTESILISLKYSFSIKKYVGALINNKGVIASFYDEVGGCTIDDIKSVKDFFSLIVKYEKLVSFQ